ncbi:hypothetical protein [Streptomyces sp. CA-111067]|uniref:hypothetical protein n=1 Tax=Streptomyces sp. CA-111067 TaxID=3240046 RepID=UPI003D953692
MPAWKILVVNATVALPVYGAADVRLPQLPQGPAALLAALAGSALATWLNVHGGTGRK